MTARSLLVAISLGLSATPVSAAELFRCRILDAVEPDAGRLARNKAISDIKLFNPIIIDTATAKMRVGQPPTNFGIWTVVQRGDSNNDFIATAGSEMIRLRVWEQPVQMIFTQAGGWRILSGVCDPIQ
jgi:hypothetical protein